MDNRESTVERPLVSTWSYFQLRDEVTILHSIHTYGTVEILELKKASKPTFGVVKVINEPGPNKSWKSGTMYRTGRCR